MTTILFSREGAYARFRPDGYIGERWNDYRKAIDGAKYDRKRRVNLAPIDKVPMILQRLRDAGFAADYEDRGTGGLHEVLLERTAQQVFDLANVQERIETVDKEIQQQTGKKLFEFQKTGAQWLTMRRGALLADDMGLGKTLQVLVAIPAGVPVLVVGPAAAKGVWVGEIQRWRPHMKVEMLSGRDSFRWPKPGQTYVINYDILPEIHDKTGKLTGRACDGLLPPPPRERCTGCRAEVQMLNGIAVPVYSGHERNCDGKKKQEEPESCPGCHPLLKGVQPGTVLVVDEAQAIKNGSSARTKKARGIARAVYETNGWNWIVTATPMENEPSELWAVLSAVPNLAQEAFGTYKAFLDLFHAQPKTIGWGPTERQAGYEWGDPDSEVTERLQRVSLRRRKEDVLSELPDLLWREVVVDIDVSAMRACDAFLEKIGGIERAEELLTGEKIRFDEMSKVLTVLAMAKYKPALELVKDYEARGEPMLVFSMHREPIDKLAERKGWLRITGSETAQQRKEIEEYFQAQDEKGRWVNDVKGVACTIQAAGVALTLTRAAHEIFIDRAWNPKQNEQAAARAHRIGQKRSVVADYLRANHPLDRRLQDVVTRKSKLFVSSVDAAAVTDDARPATSEDFREIIKRIQEEIALGHVVRRSASTPEQTELIESLHALVFRRPSDERIARELAEEAVAVGLSEKQWALAEQIAARGAETERSSVIGHQPSGETEKSSVIGHRSSGETERSSVVGRQSSGESAGDCARETEDLLLNDGMVVVDGDPHLRECARATGGEVCSCGSFPSGSRVSGSVPSRSHASQLRAKSSGGVDMKKVKKLFGEIEDLIGEEQSLLFDELDGTVIDTKKVEEIKKDIDPMIAGFTEEEKGLLVDLIDGVEFDFARVEALRKEIMGLTDEEKEALMTLVRENAEDEDDEDEDDEDEDDEEKA